MRGQITIVQDKKKAGKKATAWSAEQIRIIESLRRMGPSSPQMKLDLYEELVRRDTWYAAMAHKYGPAKFAEMMELLDNEISS